MPPSSTTEAPTNVGAQAVIPNIHRPDEAIRKSTITINSVTNERCAHCRRPMIRGGHQRPPGHVKHSARGYCHNCSSNVRRPPYPCGALKPGPNRGEVDPVVIDRVLAGDRLPMNTAELGTVIGRMTELHLSAREIATRVGCSTATVHRHRRCLRQQTAA